MKTLSLLRHAHAEPAVSPAMDDHDRVLSARGELEALNLGAFMREQKILPDLVYCSSSSRTKDTVRIAFDQLYKPGKPAFTARYARDFYLAPPDLILDEIREAEDKFSHLVVVGHNPGLEDLAEKLARAGGEMIGKFPPCSLAVFSCEIERWRDMSGKNTRLKTVFMP